MLFEVGARCKFLLADLAHVGLFARVDPFVAYQVADLYTRNY